MTTQNNSEETTLSSNAAAASQTASMSEAIIGRNEPCPCGSRKKYKRCHGVDAAPKLSAPAPALTAEGVDQAMKQQGLGGFDPSQLDPKMVSQMSQAFSRLPKGQMQRLQSLMQKAMSGKDVTREAQEFEKTLPPEFVQLMQGMAGASGMGMPTPGAAPLSEPQMSADEARAIVEKAAKEGKISQDEASEALAGATSSAEPAKGLSKIWSRLSGRK